MVGDADQSIYAFRGATIRNILEFERDYPEASDDPAGAELPLHPDDPVRGQRGDRAQRRAASPRTCGPTRATGEKIIGYVADNEHDEAAFVAQEIDRLTDDEDVKPGEVAVFYRTNAQSRVFEEVFIRVGLPYKVVGGVRFYERKEVRDLLAYLRVLGQPRTTRVAAPHPQRPQARHRRPGRGVRRGARRPRADLLLAGAAPGRRGARAWPPARSRPIKDFVALMDELRRDGGRPRRRPSWSRRCWSSSGYLAGAARPPRPAGRDPHREPPRDGSVAAEFEERLGRA